MTKEEISDFSKRIAQSNKTQLVVLTYEMILNYLDSAKKSFDDGNEGDFVFNLQKSKQFIDNLVSSLDFKYEMSYDLYSLYGYANKCITKSIIKKKNCELDAVIKMISKLMESFDKISDQDDSGIAMKNSGAVYAGLTYGKSDINEMTVPGSTYN